MARVTEDWVGQFSKAKAAFFFVNKFRFVVILGVPVVPNVVNDPCVPAPRGLDVFPFSVGRNGRHVTLDGYFFNCVRFCRVNVYVVVRIYRGVKNILPCGYYSLNAARLCEEGELVVVFRGLFRCVFIF